VLAELRSSDLCSDEPIESERLGCILCRCSSFVDSVTGGKIRIPAVEVIRVNTGVEMVDGETVSSSSSGGASILAGFVSFSCVISWCNSSAPADDLSENMNHVNPAKRDDEMKNNEVNKANAMMR